MLQSQTPTYAGLPRSLASWCEAAPEWKVRAAELLAISLSLPPEELEALLDSVFGLAVPDGWVEQLRSTPVVEYEATGFVCKQPAAAFLAAGFRDRALSEFRLAHELLVDLERDRREQGIDERESAWFFDVRIAFYLAGAEPDESVEAFERGFVETPGDGTTSARMWVTSMVLRQEALLEGHERTLAFYRGFASYVSGREEAARHHFRVVTTEPEDDRITAVAEHLLAVLERDRNFGEAIRLCQVAVERSTRLGFDVNLIMASNTLTWLWLRGARSDRAKLDEAVKLARENLNRAVRWGDPTLLARCQVTYAHATWELTRRSDDMDAAGRAAVADGLLPLLAEARAASGDNEARLFAAAQEAEVLAETDRSESAAEQLAANVILPGSRRALRRVRGVAQDIIGRPTATPRARRIASQVADRMGAELTAAVDRYEELLLTS